MFHRLLYINYNACAGMVVTNYCLSSAVDNFLYIYNYNGVQKVAIHVQSYYYRLQYVYIL